MNLFPAFHLFALGLWGGCVAVEMVLEYSAKANSELLPSVAKFHYSIDKFVELPALILVLISGLLQIDTDNLSSLLITKISFGLIAIIANFLCFIPVFQRKAAIDRNDQVKARSLSKQVFLSFNLGFPAGLVALILGLHLLSVF